MMAYSDTSTRTHGVTFQIATELDACSQRISLMYQKIAERATI
jgi:hypothetical protein